jgi:hypothetical protein
MADLSEKLQKIAEQIEQLNVVELADLAKYLEDKFGVTAAPMAVAALAGLGQRLGRVHQLFRIERSVIPVSGYTGNLLPGTTNQATLLRVEAAG